MLAMLFRRRMRLRGLLRPIVEEDFMSGHSILVAIFWCQTREGSSSADMCKSCSLPCNDNSFCTQVQSVLLLLGGRETAANMPCMSFTYHQNNRDLPNTPQRFNVPQRLASLIRFRERGCNGIKANLLLQSLFMKILPLQLQVGTRAKVDTQTADSIDVLHCYYAHGEDNENFQRRSYWMLDKRFENIVLVHYREVKEGYKPGFPHVLNADSGSLLPTSESSLSPSCEDQTVYTSDLNPVDRNQLSASSILNDGYSSEDVGISFLEQPTNGNAFDADKDPHGSGFPGVAFHPVPYSSTWNNFGDTITTDLLSFKLTDADNHSQDFLSSENGLFPQAHAGFEASIVNHGNCSDDAGGLKKLDNFGRWMDKEMGGDCEDSLMASDFGNYWNALDDKNQVSSLSHHMQLNTDSVDPSLPKEQLLSIFDFAPDWAYSGIETKVVDETDRLLGESYQPWLPTVL